MKAVLEFNYPQDTDKCRRAIHADEAFDMLLTVRQFSEVRYQNKADMEKVLRDIHERVIYALETTGEI
jgi:hypothetical protein